MEIFEKVVEFNRDILDNKVSIVYVRLGLASGSVINGAPTKLDKAGNGILRTKDGGLIFVDTHTIRQS